MSPKKNERPRQKRQERNETNKIDLESVINFEEPKDFEITGLHQCLS